MKELERLYIQVLKFGLLNVRAAARSGDLAWVLAEAELLHEIPRLVGCDDSAASVYFWDCTRVSYLNWMINEGSEQAQHQSGCFYNELFAKMEPLIAQIRSD